MGSRLHQRCMRMKVIRTNISLPIKALLQIHGAINCAIIVSSAQWLTWLQNPLRNLLTIVVVHIWTYAPVL